MHDGRWGRGDPGIEVFDVEVPQPTAPRARGTAGGAGRAPQGRCRRLGWRPISLLAIAALAAVAVWALADRPSAVSSPSTALATTTPAAPTAASPSSPIPTIAPAAPATLGPDWPAQIDLPLITVPMDAARVTAREPGVAAPSAGSRSGPFLYGSFSEVAADLSVLDIGRRTRAILPLPLKKGEVPAGSRCDGTWLAVEVEGQDRNGGPTMPWRLLVARVGPDGHAVGGAGGFTQIAAGTGEVPGPGGVVRAPEFELVAGRLAWVVGSPSGGSVVRVRALDGHGTASYTTSQYPIVLTLSAEAVAWVESPDPTGGLTSGGLLAPGVTPPAWQVMEAGPSDAEAHKVDIVADGTQGGAPLPRIVLNGGAIVATMAHLDMGSTWVVEADADGLTVIDDGSHGRACSATAAADGVVLLTCAWPGIMRASPGPGTMLYLGAAWTPSSGLRVITLGNDEPPTAYEMIGQAGWAVLVGDQWTAIPMSALTAP